MPHDEAPKVCHGHGVTVYDFELSTERLDPRSQRGVFEMKQELRDHTGCVQNLSSRFMWILGSHPFQRDFLLRSLTTLFRAEVLLDNISE